MAKASLNRAPNAGRMSAADSNRTITNVDRKKSAATTTIIQTPSGPSTSLTVTATPPLNIVGNTISIPQATGSVSGYLLASDWTTFNAKMTNPMTTTGDLILGGSGGTPTRLGIGTSTYVLTSNGTTASWQAAGGGGSSGLFAASIVTPPALASFTWLNQGASTAAQGASTAIYMFISDSATNLLSVLYKAPPATPYSIVTFMRATLFQANSQLAGLYFYDHAGSGKLLGFETVAQAPGHFLRVVQITNPTTYNTQVANTPTAPTGLAQGGLWQKIRNDGATLYFDVSTDGVNYHNLYSEAVGAWLTPDSVAWGGFSAVSLGGYYADLSLISWSELNVATL
jgi:hypothetical protein